MVVGEGIGIMDNLINNRYRLEFNNIKNYRKKQNV